jgi:hypothetical protein
MCSWINQEENKKQKIRSVLTALIVLKHADMTPKNHTAVYSFKDHLTVMFYDPCLVLWKSVYLRFFQVSFQISYTICRCKFHCMQTGVQAYIY